MILSSTDPTLYLLDRRDIEENLLSDHLEIYRHDIQGVIKWAYTYLCQPHARLGREGPVCPYTELSLERGLFWLTVYSGPNATLEEVSTIVTKYREWFLELQPVEGKAAEYK